MKSKEFLEKNYERLTSIFNTIQVGIFITDSNGKVLMINDESIKTGGLSRKEWVGGMMEDFRITGVVDESAILKTLDTKQSESVIQTCTDGTQLYIKSTPYFENGQMALVICTERDITETMKLEKLLEQTEKITEKQRKELEDLRDRCKIATPNFVAESFAMKNVMATAERVAHLDTTVLITGESGTGKEVVTNYIHQCSSRVKKPFLKVNCAAIPENLLESELFGYEKGAFTGASQSGKLGIFELANGGTLFLDEISEMAITLQAKLLRAIQEKEIMKVGGKEPISVDVRLIAATNCNLKRAVEEKRFREDLYYRLNVLPIDIPPLRMRKEDIGALVNLFLNSFCKEYNMKKIITTEVMELLKAFSWPGNVRELRNVIERLVVGFDGIEISERDVKDVLCIPILKSGSLDEAELSLDQMLDEYEREILIFYMEKYKTITNMAEKLKMDKSTISRKLKKHSLHV